jgi:hypothetical protein
MRRKETKRSEKEREHKNETPLHLLAIEPATPATPETPPYARLPTATHCHPLLHLPSPISNIKHQTSHHIHTSSLTHNHPTQQISHSLYTLCCSMKHRPESTHTMQARWILNIWRDEHMDIWKDEKMNIWKDENIDIWCMGRK